jgi:glycosyltransferase involved in cell wall biosynthesis
MTGKIAVCIPCYNEAPTIEQTVLDYKRAIPEATVYVYDNNSTDGSDELARAAGAVVGYETKQGKGNVVRTMFRDIDADCYVLTDADAAFPAKLAIEPIKLILSGRYDMVVGDRLTANYAEENKRAFHGLGNDLVKRLVNFLFKGNVGDIMSGFRILSKTFVKSFPVMSPGFELETEMTIHGLDNKFSILSIPVEFKNRPEGNESKLNTFRDGIKVLVKIFNMFKDYRPLFFFGVVSLILLGISLIMLIPSFVSFLELGYILSLPKLLLAGLFALASLQSFVTGLILDTQGNRSRQSLQVKINIIKMLSDRQS